MFKYVIEGGASLKGNIAISGSKNSALSILPVAILTDQAVNFTNLPHVHDISSMLSMFFDIGADISMLGASVENENSITKIQFCKQMKSIASYDFVKKMRASVLVLGPMLARLGHAAVSLPGGCAIGTRPVDLHIMAMERLGATITLENGYITATARNGLHGNTIIFPKVTVGGTINAIMAAVLAKGGTKITNAATEPEIIATCEALVSMGAKITGYGSSEIEIQGVDILHGANIKIPIDRIQAFTYIIASAATGCGIEISGATMQDLIGTIDVLESAGIKLTQDKSIIKVSQMANKFLPIDVITAPTPGFPTDCQAQLMALLSTVNGTSNITEEIFENRMMHVSELVRMGADIKLEGHKAIINGVKFLSGAEVMATDLRASASLVIAGLMAHGKTIISRTYHIDRGYDFLPAKLEKCGAKILKVQE